MTLDIAPKKLVEKACAVAARSALSKGEFVPYFQPIVAIRSGQLSGFEILARWNHPKRGIILPDQFIPSAEKHGWIDALTEQVLRKAFKAASSIPPSLTLSLNISPLQLRTPDLPNLIRDAAENSGFCLDRLIVEITESALIGNMECVLGIATKLKSMGCKLSLDDFGTGYSSLFHLQSLPFDELKVDRSFVHSMTTKRESRKIVGAVVGLGHSLGLTTVAEGIETDQQAEMMRRLGCQLGQGWLYGKPVPSESLASAVSLKREEPSNTIGSPWKAISGMNLDGPPSQRLAQLQAVYDSAPVGLAFIDLNLRYVNLNKRLADMNGKPVEAHLGTEVCEMIPDLFPVVEPFIRRALAGEAITGVEVQFPNSSETRLVSYQPARDEAGEIVGMSVAISDVTEQKQVTEALRESEEHYRSMVDLNPQVLWVMDSKCQNIEISTRWEQITGQTKQQSAGLGWANALHPDDTRKTIKAISKLCREGSSIDVEYRVGHRCGTWRWMRTVGSPRRDGAGNIVEWYGSVIDIDELKQTQEALLKSEARYHKSITSALPPIDSSSVKFEEGAILSSAFAGNGTELCAHLLGPRWSGVRQIFDSIANGITIVDVNDPEMPVVYVNPAFEQLTGYSLAEVQGRNCRFLQGSERMQSGVETVKKAVQERRQVQTIIKNFKKDGTPFWNELKLSPLKDNAGRVTHYLGIQHDATPKIQAEAKLTHMAHHDMLTGLANRTLLMDRLDKTLLRATRSQRLAAILFLDLDNFKCVNDIYGHDMGDSLLKVVAYRLANAVREHETVARLGGDEFVVVLEDLADENEAQRIVQRLTAELQQPVCLSQDTFDPSVSIGMAIFPRDGETSKELMRAADMSMYLAKHLSKSGEGATRNGSLSYLAKKNIISIYGSNNADEQRAHMEAGPET
jgi:diguanylate cyclase (GGDEF)-like protein/PAS domain S-box-containing protein